MFDRHIKPHVPLNKTSRCQGGKGKNLYFSTILSQNRRAIQVGKDLQDRQVRASTRPTEPRCRITSLSTTTEGQVTEIPVRRGVWEEANENGAPRAVPQAAHGGGHSRADPPHRPHLGENTPGAPEGGRRHISAGCIIREPPAAVAARQPRT